MQDIIGRLDVTQLSTGLKHGNICYLIWLYILHVHHVPVFDSPWSIYLRGCAGHHYRVVWLRVFNEPVQLQLVEHTDSLLWVPRLRAQSNHNTHHLFVDVLAFNLFLHAIAVNLPAPLKVLSLRIAIYQSGIAYNVWYKTHILSHIT